jgi:insulysin
MIIHIGKMVFYWYLIQEAIKLAEIAEEGLGTCSCSSVELNDHALILPEGMCPSAHNIHQTLSCSRIASNFVWASPIPNPNQANSALTYYVHFGPIVNQHRRVVSSLLTQILTEPAFNVLRTQEQLGYIVSCSPWLLSGASEKGLRIVVQSEKNPGYLEERVEAFLDGMKSTIEAMSDEVFAEQRSGLEKKWLEIDKNLADEHSRFAAQINSGHWDFLRRMSCYFR